MKQIANIINFARGVEPRTDDDSYLLGTLREELELCKKYGFRSTVLLQYDALTDPEYISLVRSGYDIEVGLWLETVQPQAEDAGLTWKGRYPWDWDVRRAFLTGYTPEERVKLLDAAFLKYKEIFGCLPTAVGCWTMDAFSMRYIAETYAPKAFCFCKEQYGTDGITLWGGVPAGAYYPSKTNSLLPANTAENQIPMPVFRMLGADPIDQYDLGWGDPSADQHVSSLEPVYAFGGGSERWVNWFLRENYNGDALSLAYAQFGQENSFGWEEIKKGLPMQMEKLKALVDAGKVELQTLGESGEWFSAAYALTPPNCCLVRSDEKNTGRQTMWYASRYYRVNLYCENGAVWIRDFQLYADAYAEPFLNEANPLPRCGHFALPLTDGFRFSKDGVRAGIYPFAGNRPLTNETAPAQRSAAPDTAELTWGETAFTAREQTFTVRSAAPDFRLVFRHAEVDAVPYKKITPTALYCSFCDFTGKPFDYAVTLRKGRFAETAEGIAVLPDETGEITFDCRARAERRTTV